MLTQTKTRGTTLPPNPEGYMAPWTERTRLHFDPMLGYFPMPRCVEAIQPLEPQAELNESEDAFYAHISLPGFDPEQVQIEATRHTFTLYAERPALNIGEFPVAPIESGLTRAMTVQVTYHLPEEIAPEQIRACFDAGVLYLQMPKRELAHPSAMAGQIPVPE